MALSAANAIAQLNKVRAFGDKLVASAKSGFADAPVVTMEQAAQQGDSVAKAAVEEKKAEAKTSLIRTGLLDILMGALMVFVALRYNEKESRGWLKILTCVAAFFFWPLYGLYYLIRAGLLGQTHAILELKDLNLLEQSQKGFSYFGDQGKKVVTTNPFQGA
jgi:hypothetical protein